MLALFHRVPALVDTSGMRTPQLAPPTKTDLSALLARWSRVGNAVAIKALCAQVAETNVAQLEEALFVLLDRDDSSLAATLDLIVDAVACARRTRQGSLRLA